MGRSGKVLEAQKLVNKKDGGKYALVGSGDGDADGDEEDLEAGEVEMVGAASNKG